jgi:hypothetical protein
MIRTVPRTRAPGPPDRSGGVARGVLLCDGETCFEYHGDTYFEPISRGRHRTLGRNSRAVSTVWPKEAS